MRIKTLALTLSLSLAAQTAAAESTQYAETTTVTSRAVALVADLADVLISSDEHFAELLWVHRVKVTEWDFSIPEADAIHGILIDWYLDNTSVTAVAPSEVAYDKAADNLNYRRSVEHETFVRLAAMKVGLRHALSSSNRVALFTLDSQGYGSFGEGSGFAVLDHDTDELVIVLTGYGE